MFDDGVSVCMMIRLFLECLDERFMKEVMEIELFDWEWKGGREGKNEK